MNCQSKNRFAGKYFNRHSIDSGHAQAHGSEELAQSSEQQSAALMSQNFSVRWSLAFWNCPLQISIEWPRMFVADMIQFYWIDLYKANILKYTEFFFSKFSYNFSVQNFSRIHSASEKKICTTNISEHSIEGWEWTYHLKWWAGTSTFHHLWRWVNSQFIIVVCHVTTTVVESMFYDICHFQISNFVQAIVEQVTVLTFMLSGFRLISLP